MEYIQDVLLCVIMFTVCLMLQLSDVHDEYLAHNVSPYACLMPNNDEFIYQALPPPATIPHFNLRQRRAHVRRSQKAK